MGLITATPARRRHRTWTATACAAAGVAAAGLAALGRWPGVAVWIVLVGAVGAHWAGRRASDCAVLVRLAGIPIAQIAIPPARVRPSSTTPVADVARIRAAGCGVVEVDGVDRVLPPEHIDRYEVDVLLTGGWGHVALPATTLDGAVPVDLLARLPHEVETWLVHTRLTTLALGAAQLRAAARTGPPPHPGSPEAAQRISAARRVRRTVVGSHR